MDFSATNEYNTMKGDLLVNVVICDDDQRVLKELKGYVSSFFSEKKIAATYKLFSDGESAVRAC